MTKYVARAKELREKAVDGCRPYHQRRGSRGGFDGRAEQPDYDVIVARAG